MKLSSDPVKQSPIASHFPMEISSLMMIIDVHGTINIHAACSNDPELAAGRYSTAI